MTRYHWKLLVFLSVATFFEGFDFIALSQLLPELREAFSLSKVQAGWMVAIINTGTIFAYLLVRLGDKLGRKQVLMITILGYTVATFLTAFAVDAVTFTIAQFVARIFLIAEWATSMVIATEEFPTKWRGTSLGVIGGVSSLGSIACAGAVPFLLTSSLEWRTVYLVGIVPLLLLAFARRGLRETKRFEEESGARYGLLELLRGPYRNRMLQLAAIWGLTYLCTNTAVTFWKEFAVGERNFTDGEVGLAITMAALFSMPLIFAVGPMLDLIGRKRGAAVVFTLGIGGTFFAYTLHGQWALTAALVFGIFGASAPLPVLNAFSTELFPTALRADAFAWSNNLLGRIGYVLSPLLVTVVAEQTSWSLAVRLTTIFPVLALILVLWLLPETAGKALEETAKLPA